VFLFFFRDFSRPLEDGDLVNVDVTVYLEGYHGDTSRTFSVGAVVSMILFVLRIFLTLSSDCYLTFSFSQDAQGQSLISATNASLEAGILACGPGKPFKGIGRAIHQLATPLGFAISTQFSGHGIGTVFHRPPWIVHSRKYFLHFHLHTLI